MSWENIERGEYEVGGVVRFFRSKWEANYARYLEFLKKQKIIKDWAYECEIFEFPVKHGTTRYLPDFKVWNNDGSTEFHEVKGHMTPKARTQLKRMDKYHKEIVVKIIDREFYEDLKKRSGKLLKFY